MDDDRYLERRSEIETYFDRTAAEAWSRLTSNAPVSRIRQTVREGRDSMRAMLLEWLPEDLRGRRLLDAGCGTGALSIEAARRGAQVVAVDLSPTLVQLARERLPAQIGEGSIEFRVGDMASMELGDFDHVVAMDSLIHYDAVDGIGVLAGLADRVRSSMLITHAPSTPLLEIMHAVGKIFPRGDRSPAIQPVSGRRLAQRIAADPRLGAWQVGRTERISRGFYISQALELQRP